MVSLSIRVPITIVKIEMANFIKKLVGTGSSTSSSRIDEQIRQIQENTQKYENKLFVSIEDWEQYTKILGKAKTKHQRTIQSRKL